MPGLSVRRGRLVAAAAGASLICLAVGPSVASAALAPVRTVGIDANGARTPFFFAQQSSLDGGKILGFDETPASDARPFRGGMWLRDVAAGTTTPVAQNFEYVGGVSNDLTWITLDTTHSYVAQDTNDGPDTYLRNLKTGEYRLMGRDQDGNLPADGEFQGATVTPDGKTVVEGLRTNVGTADSPSYRYSTYRYDIATRAITKTATTGKPLPTEEISDDGRVEVTTDGIFTATKHFELPTNVGGSSFISPDGNTIVAHSYNFASIVFFDTRTGAVHTAAVPSWLGNSWSIVNAANDGSATLADYFGAEHDTRVYRIGRLRQDGSLSQIGGDVPVGAGFGQRIEVTRDDQFAYSGLVLAKLGSAPLPGTEPVAPSTTVIGDYVGLGDSYCTTNALQRYSRPTLALHAGAQATDFRTAKSATVKVFKTSTGVVTGTYKLTPGATPTQIYTGYTGNFSVTGTVTFWDGSTISGTTVVPAHASPPCFII